MKVLSHRLIVLALLGGVGACVRESSTSEAVARDASPVGGDAGAVGDREVAPFQRELLELAFEAASKFPKHPHAKNRGRAQEEVLVACFELGLPNLALGFAPRTEGWRRGVAYADYAYCSVRQGVVTDVDEYLALAEAVAVEESRRPNVQQWRVDKVRLKIARVLGALGRIEEASQLTGSIEASSSFAVDGGWAQTVATRVDGMTPVDAQRELDRITDTFTNQSLGEQFASLCVLGGMHAKFFAETDLREALEERILTRFYKLPAKLRLDVMAPLVRNHLDHQQVQGARQVLVEMAALVTDTSWRPEDKVPQLARLAELRVATGEPERAREELAAALAFYMEHRDDIFDIYRRDALQPVAMAYYELDDTAQGSGLLALSVEEFMENPNSRPRCDDLVATCVALAKRRVEPSKELMTRLRQISAGLGEPW